MGPDIAAATSWWIWPLALFGVCFVLGIIAVPAGVGGGVLFVPIVSGFFPFHLDFVRGAGLLVAALAAPMFSLPATGTPLPSLLALAFVVQYAGIATERWFFLADSTHPQNLYYQGRS